MTISCTDARRKMVDLFDLDIALEHDEIVRHLETCASCSAEWEALAATVAAVLPDRSVRASPELKARVMRRIAELQDAAQ